MFTLEALFKGDLIHYHATPFYFSGLEKAYQEVFEMANKGAADLIWSVVEPIGEQQPVQSPVRSQVVNRGAW